VNNDRANLTREIRALNHHLSRLVKVLEHTNDIEMDLQRGEREASREVSDASSES